MSKELNINLGDLAGDRHAIVPQTLADKAVELVIAYNTNNEKHDKVILDVKGLQGRSYFGTSVQNPLYHIYGHAGIIVGAVQDACTEAGLELEVQSEKKPAYIGVML